VIESYKSTILSALSADKLVLSGPKVLTHVMLAGAERARRSLESDQKKGRVSYFILLVVTHADGRVAEMEATLECLSNLRKEVPMSVILVGVRPRRALDDDGSGVMPSKTDDDDLRDLARANCANCIYIPFEEGKSTSTLADLALRDLPDQIVNWFQEHQIEPSAPINVGEREIVVSDQEDVVELALGFIKDVTALFW
jgi:hypothetical protein